MTTSTGALLKKGETDLDLGSGIDIKLPSGINVHFAGNWLAYNTPLRVLSVAEGIKGSFTCFGFASKLPGLVALNFSSNDADADAFAKVRIPLQ